jgi:predicted nucleotidyltransferase component of viral defense system
MAIAEAYRRQVELLVRLIPLVDEEKDFALKGGTAINLFVRDLPRLSVDIDLAYLPIEDRAASLAAIDAGMRAIAKRAEARLLNAHATFGLVEPERSAIKTIVQVGRAQVKVEATPVLRGSVYPPERRAVSPRVEDEFGFAEMAVLAFADLYAGKAVAALDRQHPRDLFDIRDLLANEGITDELREAFVVYLLGHNRGLHEVLDPGHLDIAQEFARGFAGMTDRPVALEDLYAAREAVDHLAGRSHAGAAPPTAHRLHGGRSGLESARAVACEGPAGGPLADAQRGEADARTPRRAH